MCIKRWDLKRDVKTLKKKKNEIKLTNRGLGETVELLVPTVDEEFKFDELAERYPLRNNVCHLCSFLQFGNDGRNGGRG